MIGAERRIAGFPVDKPNADVPLGLIDLTHVSFTEICEWYDAGRITKSQFRSIHRAYDKMISMMMEKDCHEI